MSKTLLRFYGWFLFAVAVFFGAASLFVMIAWLGGLAYRALAGD